MQNLELLTAADLRSKSKPAKRWINVWHNKYNDLFCSLCNRIISPGEFKDCCVAYQSKDIAETKAMEIQQYGVVKYIRSEPLP